MKLKHDRSNTRFSSLAKISNLRGDQPNFLQGRPRRRGTAAAAAKPKQRQVDIPAALHRDVIYSQSAFLNDKGSLGRLTKAHTVGRHIRTVCGVRSPLRSYIIMRGPDPSRGPSPFGPCVTGCHHWDPALIYIARGPRRNPPPPPPPPPPCQQPPILRA